MLIYTGARVQTFEVPESVQEKDSLESSVQIEINFMHSDIDPQAESMSD